MYSDIGNYNVSSSTGIYTPAELPNVVDISLCVFLLCADVSGTLTLCPVSSTSSYHYTYINSDMFHASNTLLLSQAELSPRS